MNFISRLFASPEEKASRAYAIHMQQLQKAVWTPRNYEAFAQEGFKINVVGFQAIMKIANSIGSLKWNAFDANGNQLEKHPFLTLSCESAAKPSCRHWEHEPARRSSPSP